MGERWRVLWILVVVSLLEGLMGSCLPLSSGGWLEVPSAVLLVVVHYLPVVFRDPFVRHSSQLLARLIAVDEDPVIACLVGLATGQICFFPLGFRDELPRVEESAHRRFPYPRAAVLLWLGQPLPRGGWTGA